MASLEDSFPHTENSGGRPPASRLSAFLGPPLLPFERDQADHLFQQVTVGTGLFVTLATVVDVVFGLWLGTHPYDPTFDLLVMVSLGIVMLAVAGLRVRAGYRLAAWVLLIWLAGILAVRAFIGVQTLPLIVFGQVLPVLLAGLLLGWGAGYVVALLALGIDVLVVRLSPVPDEGGEILAVLAFVLGGTALVTTWYAEHYRSVLRHLSRAAAAAHQAEADAHGFSVDLQVTLEATRESYTELATLYTLTQDLAHRGNSIETVADLATAASLDIADVTFSLALLAAGEELRSLAPCWRRPLDRSIGQSPPAPLSQLPALSIALRANETTILTPSSLELLTRLERALVGAPPATAVALVPLRWQDRPLGLLVLGEQRRWQRTPIAPSKLRLVERAAHDVSGALNRIYRQQPGTQTG